MGELFRGKFLAFLAAAYKKKRLHLFGPLAGLQDTAEFGRFLGQLRSLNWVVYAKASFGGPEHVVKYLARYTHRVAISNGRLSEMRDDQVTFRWRDSADGNQQKRMTLEVVEFLRRFLFHALPPGFKDPALRPPGKSEPAKSSYAVPLTAASAAHARNHAPH